MGYGVWSGFFRFFPVFFPIKRLKLFLRYRHQIVEIQIGKTVLNKVGKVIILRIVHKHAVNIGFHTVLQKVDGCLYPVQPVLSSRVSNLYIKMESLRFGQDVFIPFLERHTELTPEDEKLLAEIVATESDWNRKGGDKEQTEETEAHGESTEDALLGRGSIHKNFGYGQSNLPRRHRCQTAPRN